MALVVGAFVAGVRLLARVCGLTLGVMAILILMFLFFRSFYAAGYVFKSFELLRHLWLMVT